MSFEEFIYLCKIAIKDSLSVKSHSFNVSLPKLERFSTEIIPRLHICFYDTVDDFAGFLLFKSELFCSSYVTFAVETAALTECSAYKILNFCRPALPFLIVSKVSAA